MSSLERKTKRNQMKQQYNRFKQAFKNVKSDQQERLSKGMKLGDDEFQLTKALTFNQYVARVNQLEHASRRSQTLSPEVVKQEEKIDKKWEDQ